MTSPRRFPYVVVDVFTRTRFGGNPLAVVTDARGLSDIEMQLIAREFNFSETTFVLPPELPENTARVRIFNRTQEMPFAGHPNVGTACVLGRQQNLFGKQPGRVMQFEERAGLVEVQLLPDEGGLAGATITAPQPLSVEEPLDPAVIAACVQLKSSDIRVDRHRPCQISVGLPFVVAEVTPHGLAEAQPDVNAFRKAAGSDRHPDTTRRFSLFLYTRADLGEGRLRARMFAPLSGTFEDSATGSASAALAAFLATMGGPADGEIAFTLEQGVEMGRPSEIALLVQKTGGVASRVDVSGRCVEVMSGDLAV